MNMNAGIHDAMTLAASFATGSDAALDIWAATRLRVVREALLPRTDSRVAADPGEEVARMAALGPEAARQWAREASMLDLATQGMPA
jgi:hypothetical protein